MTLICHYKYKKVKSHLNTCSNIVANVIRFATLCSFHLIVSSKWKWLERSKELKTWWLQLNDPPKFDAKFLLNNCLSPQQFPSQSFSFKNFLLSVLLPDSLRPSIFPECYFSRYFFTKLFSKLYFPNLVLFLHHVYWNMNVWASPDVSGFDLLHWRGYFFISFSWGVPIFFYYAGLLWFNFFTACSMKQTKNLLQQYIHAFCQQTTWETVLELRWNFISFIGLSLQIKAHSFDPRRTNNLLHV